MSLFNKIMFGGSVFLSLIFSPQINEQEFLMFSPLHAEEVNCKSILEKNKKKLEGSFFPLRKGCLSTFKPENANRIKGYESDFVCIKSFIDEYESAHCEGSELYDASISALLQNVHSSDPVVRNYIRSILKKNGVINYSLQLEKIVSITQKTQFEIHSLAKKYSLTESLSERKKLEEKFESEKNYLNDLRVAAMLITNQALFMGEKPKMNTDHSLDEKLAKGIQISYKTIDDLAKLHVNLSEDKWVEAYRFFKEWKKDQKETYETLLTLVEKEGEKAVFEIGKGSEWVRVGYLDHQGKWQIAYVAKDFAEEWGENGEKYYEKIKEMDELISQSQKIELRYVKKSKNDSGIISGSAQAKIEVKVVSITKTKQGSDTSIKADGETNTKKKCMPWEQYSECYRRTFEDMSSPEKTFEALKKFLRDEEFGSYNPLFCWGGLKNDAKYELYSFSPKNLEECYRKKILHEPNRNCVEETRSNKFVDDLISYRKGRYNSKMQSLVQDGTILWPSDLRGGKTALNIKKMRLQNGEEIKFLEMSDSAGKSRYRIIDRFDVD